MVLLVEFFNFHLDLIDPLFEGENFFLQQTQLLRFAPDLRGAPLHLDLELIEQLPLGCHQSAGLAQSFDLADLRGQFPFFLQEWFEQEHLAGF